MAVSLSEALQCIQEFDSESVQREWVLAWEKGELQAALRQHWAQFVPLVYTLKSDVDPLREERKARRLLFRPMEAFICGGDPDPVLRSLKESDPAPVVCGRVFKMGEPTYSCRDCGQDPTCVLCITCFQNSTHNSHRYKMSTSQGGGYCDCGDVEAWKTEPFCKVHKRGLDKKDYKDPMDRLPADLRERAEALFIVVTRYAVEMLTWGNNDELPENLKPDYTNDTYATMLFNDEVHTYEQVITTLQRAIECTQKEAVEFATIVDREGRSCVKTGPHTNCDKSRNVIERNTSRHGSKPLKVLVMHTAVVAHQLLAQKILAWIQQVIINSDGLRQLFCVLSMKTLADEEKSLVEKMMLADTQLWKSARVLSHQLFMAGVLVDPECKKQFAILFTKMYPQLMDEFIADDHDHGVCAVSESVQIYTVPTLARMLITEHNLLQVILSTFLQQCQHKKKDDGKFAFERNERSQSFRRAQYMLYDMKYALTCRPAPGEWTPALRTNFLKGFHCLLELLKCMQGMDMVQRETGQHIEYEPEWEGAFNLQLKLADNIGVIQEWCATDEEVLRAAFNATLDTLNSCRSEGIQMEKCTVAEYEAECIKYDVASKKVSIHLPVTRLLAGLYTLMPRFNISLHSLHQAEERMGPVELMEPALRVQVLIGQSQAGMWRRNGYSLLNQIYFYHNVRCQTEMYDKDIIMLQAAASLLDPNEFLIQLLNRYSLLNWSRAEYDVVKLNPAEDLLRQTVTLAEEWLGMIIILVGERFTPGVGQVRPDDVIRRELIHLLCIQPQAHSDLVKALPEDSNHETGIENVVQDVAVFNKPTGIAGKGLYELKPEYYEQYNPYFYHYIRSDQSKSEENQRQRKKAANEDLCLPPPAPPPLTDSFSQLRHLLDCDVMMHIIRLIISRTSATRSRSWSETQFEKAITLIGIAMHEARRAHDNQDSDFKFIEKSQAGSPPLLTMLEGLSGNDNITHEPAKALLTWVIKQFRELRTLYDASIAMETGSLSDLSADTARREAERFRKSEMAKKRRARIMAQMSKMQKEFIQDNSELFENTSTDMAVVDSSQQLMDTYVETGCPVCVGANRNEASVGVALQRQTCILCQEEQDINHSERACVLAAFVQKSTVISRKQGTIIPNADEHDPLFMNSALTQGTHIGTCGHVMHSDCWQRFYDAIVTRERRRTLRFRHQPFSYDIDKNEFLCPLCETLSNTVIPLLPSLSNITKNKSTPMQCTSTEGEGSASAVSSQLSYHELSLQDWLDAMQKTLTSSIKETKDIETHDSDDAFLYAPCPLSSITKMMADSVARQYSLLFDDSCADFSETIMDMLKKFASDTYSHGLGVEPDEDNNRVPLLAWSSCAFTIQVTEQGLRDEGRPLFGDLPSRQHECLQSLVRFAATCNQVIQTDVIKKHCINLLSALLMESPSARLQSTPNLLDIDLYHYLVYLCLALPTLYAETHSETDSAAAVGRVPTGGLNEQHVLQLTLTAHLTQILLTADFKTPESQSAMETEDELDVEGEALKQVYVTLKTQAGGSCASMPTAWQVSSYVQEACMPFLRCAAIFFHYLTDVRAPDSLQVRGPTEYEALLHYLSLPPRLSNLFKEEQGTIINSLVKSWCSAECVKDQLSSSVDPDSSLLQYPAPVKQLVTLTSDYSQLINHVSKFTCPKSEGDESRAPTMCLVCGVILCSQSYCCQSELNGQTVGAATAHAHTCGAGTGIFLRVRECQVLMLSGRNKGCFYSPPYLDDYGETDQGLRRGNPLHLCLDRYQKLQKIWQSHAIPETIAHSIESNNNLLSIDWQHL